MFFVRQRVDGGKAGVLGEFLHVLLRVSPDDRAMNHPSEHPGGVLDRFAASELNVGSVEEQ